MEFTKEDRNLCMRAAKLVRGVAADVLEATQPPDGAYGNEWKKAIRQHERLLAENERLKTLGRKIQGHVDKAREQALS